VGQVRSLSVATSESLGVKTMISIKALCKDTFEDVLINPDHIAAVIPVFIKGDTVDMSGTPVGVNKAMLVMSGGQQFVIDLTVDKFRLGIYRDTDDNEDDQE